MKLRRPLGPIRFALAALIFAAIPVDGQEATDTLGVFFLGNSYVYFNNLPGLVEGLSRGLPGPLVLAAGHTHGGFTLRRHMEDGHFPDALETAESSEGIFEVDVVVLQEQSSLGTPMLDEASGQLGASDDFQESVRDLVPTIRQAGAEALLYMTWAKQRWPQQITDLEEAYLVVGEELDVPVAVVGTAWSAAIHQRPDLGLYLGDGSHPNPAGSYLAACVLYATLTGLSPVGAPRELAGTPWNFGGPVASDNQTILASLSEEDAGFLQRLAWETVSPSSDPR
jgi:hypothetical protein